MLFRRKRPVGRIEQLRRFLWPSKGFVRPFLYHAKCTLRLADNAHAIAIGVACGAFVSFTPFMGLHIILACALAWLLSGNMVAAAIGTAVGNPFTFPAIWLAAYRTGSFILGRGTRGEGAAENFGEVLFRGDGPLHHILIRMWEPLIWPMLVGGVPLGLAVGAACYWIARPAVSTFQATRLARREAKERAAPHGGNLA